MRVCVCGGGGGGGGGVISWKEQIREASKAAYLSEYERNTKGEKGNSLRETNKGTEQGNL